MHLYRDLKQFAKYPFDILVVGGGFTGANIARDAAMRGLRVGVVEAHDFGWAIFPTLAKDMHENVRYLSKRQFRLIRDSIRERLAWQTIAPHLVEPMPFVYPIYDEDKRDLNRIRSTFRLHDLVFLQTLNVGAHPSIHPGFPCRLGQSHHFVEPENLLRNVDGLREKQLVGGLTFADVTAPYPERLCLEVLLSAAEHGAQLINYCRAVDIVKSSTDAHGIEIEDQLTSSKATAKADFIINATGAQTDTFVRKIAGNTSRLNVKYTKTIQAVTRPLTDRFELAVPTGSGSEFIYIAPCHGASVVGFSSDAYRGDPSKVSANKSDIDQLVALINENFPGALLSKDDIRQVAAGVRPYVELDARSGKNALDSVTHPKDSKTQSSASEVDAAKNDAARIRQELIFDHTKDGISGVLTVVGGHWSNARLLADRVVSLAMRKLRKPKMPSRTHKQPLSAARMDSLDHYLDIAVGQHSDLPGDMVEHLVRTYGSHYKRVLSFGRNDMHKIAGAYPDVEAQVRYAVHHELAVQLEDVVFRRSGLATREHPGEEAVKRVAEVMAQELGWTEAEQSEQVRKTLALLSERYLKDKGAHMAA